MNFLFQNTSQNEKTNTKIKNLLVFGINPVDENGSIKECPFDEVNTCYNLPGFFTVGKEDNYGLTDKNMNIKIPLIYKMIHGNSNGLIWVRLLNNLCGIIDLENNVIIPPIYNYLSFIEGKEYSGCYKAEINGKKGIITKLYPKHKL